MRPIATYVARSVVFVGYSGTESIEMSFGGRHLWVQGFVY